MSLNFFISACDAKRDASTSARVRNRCRVDCYGDMTGESRSDLHGGGASDIPRCGRTLRSIPVRPVNQCRVRGRCGVRCNPARRRIPKCFQWIARRRVCGGSAVFAGPRSDTPTVAAASRHLRLPRHAFGARPARRAGRASAAGRHPPPVQSTPANAPRAGSAAPAARHSRPGCQGISRVCAAEWASTGSATHRGARRKVALHLSIQASAHLDGGSRVPQ